MTRFTRLRRDQMSEEQARIADEIVRDRKSLGGPFPATLHCPHLADPFQRIGAEIRFRSAFPAALRELAILVVARHWDCDYEWYAHREVAEREGLPVNICEAILAREVPAEMTSDQRLVHDFARTLIVEGRVSDDLFDEAASRLGEGGVSELIGIVGYYCAMSFYMNVDKHPPPEGRQPLTRDEAV